MIKPDVDNLTIALSKGRILKDTLPLLAAAGITPVDDIFGSRKLIFSTHHSNIRLLILRAIDVPTYVANGTADLGVVGKDVLMEHGSTGLYEPLDLKIAYCRLMTCSLIDNKNVAIDEGRNVTGRRLRVASKFVNLTKAFYAQKGQQVDVIKLHGAMELAPVLGLADHIVDIVDTGNTLKANGLQTLEKIADISSRLIVAKSAFKLKHATINPLIEKLSLAVNSQA